jgi:DNA repair exonuclease SbcCD ATPase subunit
MSETSKRGKKDDILYAMPSGFKTIDELAKILAEGDSAKRKEDLKNWYIAGEGLQSMPPDKQDLMFAKSKDYPKYLSEMAEIDKALPQNTKAFGDFLLNYFNRLTERERASLEEKMKVAADSAKESETFIKQNKDYLKHAQEREAELAEKEKRYDAELARVSEIEGKLKKREKEQELVQGGLEQRSLQLNKAQEKLNAEHEVMRQREAAVSAREKSIDSDYKEISDALTYARMLKTVVGPKIEGFHTMLDEMASYFQSALKKLPNAQVPTAAPADELLMPGPDAGATMLGFGDLPPKKK